MKMIEITKIAIKITNIASDIENEAFTLLLVFIKLIMCDFSTNGDKKLLCLHTTQNTPNRETVLQ